MSEDIRLGQEIDQEPELACRLSPCPDAETLAPLWRHLQSRADASVFLSWPWIATLLRHAPRPAWLAEIHRGAELVGLALLGPQGQLNESGSAPLDAVMIEYNGLLTLPDLEWPAAAALLKAATPHFSALTLSGVAPDWPEFCRRQGWLHRLRRQRQTAPTVTVAAIAEDRMPPSLSRNSRGQIRRSLRHFAEFGPLRLERAASPTQALDWLAELARLHTESWRARGHSGAFDSRIFGDFHRDLVGTGFADGIVDLLRLSAGTETLGYLYNLRWRHIAYAYQSGFVYRQDPRWRPGLVAHVLALRFYGGEDVRLYRLLSGAARYKTSLADGADELLWLQIERKSAVGLVAQAARSIGQGVGRILGRP